MKTETPKTENVTAVVQPPLVRLSDPQKRLMADLASGHSASPEYKPAIKLLGYGLAEIRQGKWSGDRVVISDAGRSYFEANDTVVAPATLEPESTSDVVAG